MCYYYCRPTVLYSQVLLQPITLYSCAYNIGLTYMIELIAVMSK